MSVELPPYGVRARNTSAYAENKIHDDAVAPRPRRRGGACALGRAALVRGSHPEIPDLAAYPNAPLPAARPVATRERLADLEVLGSPELPPNPPEAPAPLHEVGD